MDDVLLNKASVIKRCIMRINQEFKTELAFRKNITAQDSVILNLQRACEASIDMGNRIIRLYDLAIPQSARDVFALLCRHSVIQQPISEQMQKMVGLRNIAAHGYQTLNIDIVIAVVTGHLSEFNDFSKSVFEYYQQNAPLN